MLLRERRPIDIENSTQPECGDDQWIDRMRHRDLARVRVVIAARDHCVSEPRNLALQALDGATDHCVPDGDTYRIEVGVVTCRRTGFGERPGRVDQRADSLRADNRVEIRRVDVVEQQGHLADELLFAAAGPLDRGITGHEGLLTEMERRSRRDLVVVLLEVLVAIDVFGPLRLRAALELDPSLHHVADASSEVPERGELLLRHCLCRGSIGIGLCRPILAACAFAPLVRIGGSITLLRGMRELVREQEIALWSSCGGSIRPHHDVLPERERDGAVRCRQLSRDRTSVNARSVTPDRRSWTQLGLQSLEGSWFRCPGSRREILAERSLSGPGRGLRLLAPRTRGQRSAPRDGPILRRRRVAPLLPPFVTAAPSHGRERT